MGGADRVGRDPRRDHTGSRPRGKGFRLLRLAGVTLVVSGTTITAMMIIGLGLEGAL